MIRRCAYIAFVLLWVNRIEPGYAQPVQTARMTTGGTGYLEKLPPDYATNPTATYPVLFFLHGTGETGNGTTDLNKVKAHGPPLLIANGSEMCFTVNGVQQCFIVISPQLGPSQGGWWPSVLNDVFNYVLHGPLNYRIDMNRVYLTGLSLGGWGAYIGAGDPTVPDIFAAVTAVSAFSDANSSTICERKTPVWAFHGKSDGTIPYSTGLTEISRIGWCTSPVQVSETKFTAYVGQGHNVWENFAYRTDNVLATPNLYQWMLSKTKSTNGPTVTITLPTNSAVLTGVVSDFGTTITSYTWTKTQGGSVNMTNANTASLSVSNLSAGLYVFRLTASDNAGNYSFDDVSVNVVSNSNPTIVITNPAPVCSPATVDITNAAITAISTPGFTFTYWLDAQATTAYPTPATATTGTYYIKGTTSGGATDIKPVTVSVNPQPNLLITNPSSLCPSFKADITSSSITAGSTSGLTLTYWTDINATNTLTNPNSVSIGTYYIKGTATSGCNTIQPVVVSGNPVPTLIINNPTVSCPPSTVDITSPTITAGSSSGLTLTYWNDNNASNPLTNPTAVASGTYYIKGTNSSGCSVISPVVVAIGGLPNLVITNPNAVCLPSTVDITTASVTIGSGSSLTFSYWQNAAATTVLSNPSSITSSGTYYIQATNVASCAIIKPVVVVINPIPNVTITNPPSVCPPATANIAASSITNGSSSGLAFSYWTDLGATNTLANPTTVSAGTYYIKGTSAAGCSIVKSVVITANPLPNVVITNPTAACPPSSIDITVPAITAGSSSGLSYSYWTDASATHTLANPASAFTGTYYIKGTNTSGCSAIKPIDVIISGVPSLVISNPAAVCAPATVDITPPSVTAGSASNLTLSYWIDANATITLANPAALAKGTYYVQAINSFGCNNIKPVVVVVNPLPNLVITNPSACLPVTVDLTASPVTSGSDAGLTFSYWNDASTTVSLSNPTAITLPNTYYVKAINSFLCSTTQPVIVSIYTAPTLVITSPSPVCAPASIDLTSPVITSGSSSGLSYSYWADPGATTSLADPTTTPNGTYYLKGADTHCFTIKPISIVVNPLPDLVINDPSPVCAPSTIDITTPAITLGSSPGLTFSYWTDVSTMNPLSNPNTTTTGRYYIRASDTHCSSTYSVNVTVSPLPNLVITNPTACAPATVDLTATAITLGSSPGLTFSYWTDANATSSLGNPTQVTNGTYYIRGGNANCFSIQPVTAVVNASPNLVLSNPAAVCEPSTVDLTNPAVTTGSTNGLTFSYWVDALAGTPLANPKAVLKAGTYYIRGKDASGCTATGPVLVALNLTPIVAVLPTKSTLCSGNTTNVQLSTFNQIPGNVSYNWTARLMTGDVQGFSDGNGNVVSQALTTVKGGTVIFSIFATAVSSGCIGPTSEAQVSVNQIPNVSVNLTASDSIICSGCTTNIVLQNPNGVAGTTFSWTPSVIRGNVTGQSSGVGQIISQVLTETGTNGIVQYSITPNVGTCIGIPITFKVHLNLAPIVNAGPDVILQLPADHTALFGVANDTDGTIKSTAWSQANGPTVSVNAVNDSLKLSDLIAGTYTFRFSATDNAGATSSDDVEVVVESNTSTTTFIRKKFITPNGDGQNDFWILDPDISKFSSCKLTIIQNDGSKVFEAIGYQNNWDGTFNGKTLPQNVYYYVLEGDRVKDSGSITIIR